MFVKKKKKKKSRRESRTKIHVHVQHKFDFLIRVCKFSCISQNK